MSFDELHANALRENQRLTAALAEAQREREWQPIETAPLDGREVLLSVEMRAGIPGKCLVGHYMPGGYCIEDHPAIAGGWYFWNGRMFDVAAKPISWMALPDTPKAAIAGRAGEMSERQFPIQASRGAKPHPLLIPWSIAELAYSVYSAEQGKAQTLERLAERGGFGPEEMDEYVPNWRERCSALAAAQQRVAVLEAALRALLHLVDWDHGPQFSEEQAEARAALASTEPKA